MCARARRMRAPRAHAQRSRATAKGGLGSGLSIVAHRLITKYMQCIWSSFPEAALWCVCGAQRMRAQRRGAKWGMRARSQGSSIAASLRRSVPQPSEGVESSAEASSVPIYE